MIQGQEKQKFYFIKRLWFIFFGICLSIFLYLFYLSFKLPSFDQLENPDYNFASQVFSEDQILLGRIYTENRVALKYSQISPHLIKALIATEDERFNAHSGVDFKAVLRVIGKTVLLGKRSEGGGSTITQQLAKLLYSNRNLEGKGKVSRFFTLVNIKLKEWLTAIKLERSYTKEEIISMYLNKFNFIYGAYGIEAASEIYFNKKASEVDLSEAAVLIGMLKNPSLYNPIKRMAKAEQRRATVLNRMVKNNFITPDQEKKALSKPIKLDYKPKSHIEGIATYFRMEVAKSVTQIIQQQNLLNSDGELYDVYRDGLKIHTTIDGKMQQIAEDVMAFHMKNVQRNFAAEWKGKDPWTYKFNQINADIREATMKNLVRASDRYAHLREEFFEVELDKIRPQFPNMQFTDIEFDIMTAAKVNGMKKVSKKFKINEDQIDKFTQVMNSPIYEDIVAKWMTFRDNVRKDFAKKYKMKVFAYNDAMEKDTLMSPYDSIKYHRFFLQTGILALNPKDGHIKAWVGGINHKYFKYDHCTSRRQVGSTFKPFIYASAITFQGVSPCQKVIDQQYSISPGEGQFNLIKSWSPSNAEGQFSGQSMTLFEALKDSKNSVSVYLMKQLGSTRSVRDLVNNLGIDSSKIPAQPSICLGAADLSVMDMLGAYGAFANNGNYITPVFITKIEDKNGKVIFHSVQDERTALPANFNRAVVELLKYAIKGAAGFHEIKSEIGGKTGTTNDYVDGWFLGITPSLVVGTWVGGDDRWIRFLSLNNGQGSKMARPFFSEFIRRLEKDGSTDFDPNAQFMLAPINGQIITDCSQYARPSTLKNETDTSGTKPGKIKGEDDFF